MRGYKRGERGAKALRIRGGLGYHSVKACLSDECGKRDDFAALSLSLLEYLNVFLFSRPTSRNLWFWGKWFYFEGNSSEQIIVFQV